jgi:hypothetical protein
LFYGEDDRDSGLLKLMMGSHRFAVLRTEPSPLYPVRPKPNGPEA